MSVAEKVKMIKFESRENKAGQTPEMIMKEVKKDMGKVAMLISILAVVLMVVFFFSLKQNVAGLEKKVLALYPVKAKVEVLDSSVAKMDKRLVNLEKLPEKTRQIIYANMLEDLSQKASFLSQKLSGEQQAKLLKARRILQQVQKGLE